MSAVLIVLPLAGCDSGIPQMYGIKVDEEQFAGPDTLGLKPSGQQVKGLIVYFHGSDQSSRVIADDRRHTDYFDPFLRAGYAVVAADAHGNAYGNPKSRADYRRLISAAQQKYIAGPVFFVAESMGALAALALISEDTGRHVKGMIGISPLMGLPPEAESLSYVAVAWGGTIPPSADPLDWPPEVFAGRHFRLHAAKDDNVIPAIAGPQAFADKFGAVADVAIMPCEGGHVALACYQGPHDEEWVSSLS
jgi:alpha-beta hydrolase superfamily lysophospholipase